MDLHEKVIEQSTSGQASSTSVQSQPDQRIPVLRLNKLQISTEKSKDIIRRSELGELSEAATAVGRNKSQLPSLANEPKCILYE